MRLSPEEKERLVSGYLSSDTDTRQNAWEDLNELVRQSPEQAWPIVLAVAAHASDSRLALLGASEIEDLLRYWGAQFRVRVVREIRKNAKFKNALQCAYLFGVASDVVLAINEALRETGTAPESLGPWPYQPNDA